MTLEQKTTHVMEGQGQLITQFRDKPNLDAWMEIYLGQVQEIEDVLWQLLGIPTDILAQEGVQLDLIGKIVGQPREGRADATYVRWLLARLAVNRASGLPDELLTVLGLVAPDNDHEYEEFYPAAFVLRLREAFAGDAASIAALLSEVRAGGVNAGLEYSTSDDAETFTFADGDSEEADLSQGFNVVADNHDFSAWTDDDPNDWTVAGEPAFGAVAGVGSGACNILNSGSGGSIEIVQHVVDEFVIGEDYTVTIVVSYCDGTLLLAEQNGNAWELEVTEAGTYVIEFSLSATTAVWPAFTIEDGNGEATIDSITFAPAGVWADVEEI
jgi:hypothetical protein